MKNTKRRLEFFAPYDYDGMTAHFEQMALNGWLIQGVRGNLWKYKKIQPQKLKFAVTHFEKFTFNEAAPDNGQNEFLQMCEASGWQLAARYNSMMVFVTEDKNAVPIETDPMVQLKNIDKSVKPLFAIKNTLLFYNILRTRLFNGMGRIMDGEMPAVNYTSLLLSLAVILLVNIDTFDYLIWRNKATNIMREQGAFYSKKTIKAVYILRAAIYALAFAYLAVFLGLIVWIMFYEMFNGGLML